MKQVVQNLKNGKTEVIEVPVPDNKEGFLLIKTAASVVSAGTERNLVEFASKSLAGKARSRPDLMKQVIDKARREGILTTLESTMNRLEQPLPLGYSSAGTVVSIGKGVKNFTPGQRVVCAGGGYAVHAEFALVPRNLAAMLPDSVSFEEGAFATLGAIALNGIRLAQPQLGEKTAIIGLGLVGLITAQLVRAAGCDVYGFDINPARVDFSNSVGVKSMLNAEAIAQYLSVTRGRGFDHVLICADTPSDDTVELAGIIARDRANIISIGVVGLNLPRNLYYEKELAFRVSRSSGPGRYDSEYEQNGKDYPLGYVRWTEGRNLEAFVDLLANQEIDIQQLITHRFALNQAEQAYDLISGKTQEDYLGVVLTYPEVSSPPQRKVEIKTSFSPGTRSEKSIALGVLGAGNYAASVFLPTIIKSNNARLVGIASSGGVSAQALGKKFGFELAASSTAEILDNKDINTIAILTRHDTHARLTLEGLKRGKHVYCEKPLSLDKEGLAKIEEELAKDEHAYLSVGFNRRFAHFSIKLRGFFINRVEPMYIHYRVNAGYLPPSHWLHDPLLGGGRLIGEGCHFIDFLTYLVGQPILRVNVSALADKGKYSQDNLNIHLDFQDGSIGTIAYLSNGNRNISKEYIEVFCAGKIGILDDFHTLSLADQSRKKIQRSRFSLDKGHRSAWQSFVSAITEGGREPIPYQEILHSSYATLASQESLRSGKAVNIADFTRSK